MIAQIQIDTQSPLVNTVQIAAQLAKEKGADAICVLDDSAHYAGSVGFGSGAAVANGRAATGFGSGFSAPTYARSAKVYAMKFKTTPLNHPSPGTK